MSRMSLTTPCPVFAPARRLSTTSTAADDTCTGDIEYTRAIQQEFKNARPRRRATFQCKVDKQAAVTIFEDVMEDEELVVDQTRMLAGKTLLSKPAQKPLILGVRKNEEWMGLQPLGEIGQSRRRSSIIPSAQPVQEMVVPAPAPKVEAKGNLKREPRRRTIFVPDDTTIMTIHPGAYNTDRLNDTFQLPCRSIEPQPLEASAAETQEAKPARKQRMSLAVAPKRIPLQQVASKSNNLPIVDVAGQNGGKENVPPRAVRTTVSETKPPKPTKPQVSRCQTAKGPLSQSRLFQGTAASQARQAVTVRKAIPLPKEHCGVPRRPAVPAQPKPTHRTLNMPSDEVRQVLAPLGEFITRPNKQITPPKRTSPHATRPQKAMDYPILLNDISEPGLYEESWLNHQEIALSELVNEIFATLQPRQRDLSSGSLREQMLLIYHQPTVVTLHKRLEASLRYGALTRPKDLPNGPDLRQDIGARKRFLDFWLETYDADALRAAAEVVIGRQIPRKACSLPTSTDSDTVDSVSHRSRRALTAFLETFLITVEDVDVSGLDAAEAQQIDASKWRKTVMRSLMLVWLLDRAKDSGAISGCLFKHSSNVKSTVAALCGLSGMIIPSIGDISRTLRYLDYEVGHVQDPLDEIVYQITNIAIDLRDGILLTRLVENLLFPRFGEVVGCASDATITITMPDMILLESAVRDRYGSQIPMMLSQHLKMPCLGRAQKVFNVNIALGALRAYGDFVLDDVAAEDIVDGHREKTLSLLWRLVSNYGLVHLIDWKELTADIRRIDYLAPALEPQSQRQREQVLQQWATARSLQSGVEIRNLSTSFAGSQGYAALLDSFAPFLPIPCAPAKAPASVTLERRLRSLGCSKAFINQLTASTSSIPSRTTTISNLAFFAARLLPLARRHNAATAIQRAFRRRRARVVVTERVVLMRLATACATVVRSRDQLVWASTVLQRAWRSVLDSRLSRLHDDVQIFQVAAKGWMQRRNVRRALVSRSYRVTVVVGW